MVRALGYSSSSFDPSDPGRLCRGRERWIDSYPLQQPVSLHRMVISGASFSDDSARDAFRGLSYSGVDCGTVLAALFPGKVLLACAEDAHPRELPSGAEGVEHYEVRRSGGPLARWAVRWTLRCESADDLNRAIAAGADVLLILDEAPEPDAEPRVLNDAPLADAHLDPPATGGLPEALRKLVFLLTGYRLDGSPARRFQAAALPDLLAQTSGVVLVHLDKHDACLGLYLSAPLPGAPEVLVGLAEGVDSLPVPFAIPPMLARWDRALWELRQDWDEATRGEYPVPPAADPSYGWGRRGGRKGSRKRRGSDEE